MSADNQAIRLECNICYSIPQVAGPGEPLPTVKVAAEKEPLSHRSTTWLAEHRFQFDATCMECHTITNPGGSDNSSFCSNSACHATEWKFVGLNAPKIKEISKPPRVPSKGVPNPIPHPIGLRTECALCHEVGKVLPWPENHSDFAADICTSCHTPTLQESPVIVTPTPVPTPVPTETPTPAPTLTRTETPIPAGPPAIPHDLAGRENCLLCHDPEGNIKPAPRDHIGRAVDTCQLCHKPTSG